MTKKKNLKNQNQLKQEIPVTPKQIKTVFQPEFLEDLKFWVENDQRVTLKVLDLVKETCQDPFKGKGKPEPLKYLDPNTWSRRLTQEHRIVYLVNDDEINFLQARYHY